MGYSSTQKGCKCCVPESGGNPLLPWMSHFSKMYPITHRRGKKYWNHIDRQQPTLVQDVPPPSYISCHSLTSLSAISTHNENEHANVENSSNVFAFESLLQEENQS